MKRIIFSIIVLLGAIAIQAAPARTSLQVYDTRKQIDIVAGHLYGHLPHIKKCFSVFFLYNNQNESRSQDSPNKYATYRRQVRYLSRASRLLVQHK